MFDISRTHKRNFRLLGLTTLAILSVIALTAIYSFTIGTRTAGARVTTITVCASGCDFTTIQPAIDAASSGDTINVAAGTYSQASGINLNKSVILQGPNAAISPNGGARVAEAIITGAVSPILRISSPGNPVTIQGFKFDNTGVVDAYDPGLNITIRKNIYSNGTSNGAFYFLNAPPQLTIDDNRLTNAVTPDNDTIFVAGDWNGTTGTVATITNNVLENTPTANASGMNLSNVSGTISGNRFTNLLYYAILLANNSSSMTVSNNVFDGMVNPSPGTVPSWGAGVRTYTPAFTGPVNIKSNLFINSYTGVGIRGVPNDPGANIGTNVHVNFNRFINNTYGISDGAAGTLDAENNWWGCNYGPGATGAGCAATTNGIFNNGSGSVDANPWLTLTPMAMPASVPAGTNSTLSAKLVINSDTVDTTAMAMFVPNGTPTTFTQGTKGTVAPTSATTTNGVANTTYTAGGMLGSDSVSMTIDGQSVSQALNVVVGPPTQLAFVQQPTNTPPNLAITPAVTVQLKDIGGNNVMQAGVSITMSLSSGTGTLSGTLTQMTSAAGLATFNNLSINQAGMKQLTAMSGVLTPAVSNTFTILSAAAIVYVDDNWVGTTPGADPDGAGPATIFGYDSFATVQGGVNGVAAGGIVNVYSGLYVEDVDINKSLNLKSVSGAAVTTIQGAGHCLPTSCPGGPVSALTLSAPGITLDGFKITTTNPTISLITADGSANSSNHVIKNNVITSPAFDDANAGGGWGILLGYGDADNNQILNNEISLNPDREKNQFTFGIWAQGGGSDNNVISGNNIHDLGTAIITDEADNNTDILNNTFSNLARRGVVVFGSTNTEIINNSISNAGTAGIQVRLGATNTTIKSNFITLSGVAPITGQTPQGGVFVSDADGGTVTGVTVNFNRLIGNVPAALNNTSGAAVNAENNWWGCNFGPGAGGAGCTGTPNGVTNTGGGSIDANPWLVLGLTAAPSTVAVGGMSGLTASLKKNSDNVDTSLMGMGTFPDGVTATFSGTLGTVAPPSALTSGGMAMSVYTAGPTPGAGSASSTVDAQTVMTPITVTVGPLATLAFVQQPTNTLVNGTITPAVTVLAKDAFNNNISGVSVTLSLSMGTGTLSGTLTQVTNGSGIATFNNLSIDATGTGKKLTATSGAITAVSDPFTILCPAITVNPLTLPNGFVGTLYNQGLSASGGTPSYTFTLASGTLPTGVNIVGASLMGTPTTTGTFIFTIKATDHFLCTGMQAYTVVISGTGLQFYPLEHPVRLVDTRTGTPCNATASQITGGTSLTVPARVTCDSLTIPANAAAVTGNVITVGPVAGGFLTIYPSNVTPPGASNSNYQTGQTLNNVFTVGLGPVDGAFKVFSSATTNLVVDITGYFAPPGAGGLFFHPLPAPVRLLDTRAMATACTTPGTPLLADTEFLQQGNAICGIPGSAVALVGNATTVGPLAQGFLTLFPANESRPLIASGNYQSGQTLNSPFTVGLSPSGMFKAYSVAQTNLVIDVLGYYSADASDGIGIGLLFSPMTPARLLDTRPLQTACFTPVAPIPAATDTPQDARGKCTIPATAQAIVGNETTVGPAAGGFLTFWPSDAARPFVAISNYAAGVNFNRHFTVGLGADGAFKIYASTSTNLVIDVSGSFAP